MIFSLVQLEWLLLLILYSEMFIFFIDNHKLKVSDLIDAHFFKKNKALKKDLHIMQYLLSHVMIVIMAKQKEHGFRLC